MHPTPDESPEQNGTKVHVLAVGRKRLGAAPLAHINGAAGVRYGTTGRCSCGWTWYTNDVPPSRGGRRKAEAAHQVHRGEAL